MQPRFRMFAGPNGSGKTFLFTHLRNKGYIHTELYVSADRIEQDLKHNRKFFFASYRIKATESEFKEHVLNSGLFQQVSDKTFLDRIFIKSGILTFNGEESSIDSYIASFIATYLCEKLFKTGQSFCYETVFSHPSKLAFFEQAKASGYSSYLYFVCTDTWKLNVERVRLRVQDGGHDVDKGKVESRYFRSMKNLNQATKLADSSFLIDNSIGFTRIAELKKGVITFAADPFPDWMIEYFDPKKD
jgi:predicted ABC-type ATPase